MVFTIAEPPTSGKLRFFIKDLGDWTQKLHEADNLVGTTVYVEGPYGQFKPLHTGVQNVWVAGGVGITPFLSAAAGLKDTENPPVLYFCVRSRKEAMGLKILEQAHNKGVLELIVVASDEGPRFNASMLEERFGDKGLKGANVAMCGPTPLLVAAEKSVRALGARKIESEDFDFRQGFGPNVDWDIERIIGF